MKILVISRSCRSFPLLALPIYDFCFKNQSVKFIIPATPNNKNIFLVKQHKHWPQQCWLNLFLPQLLHITYDFFHISTPKNGQFITEIAYGLIYNACHAHKKRVFLPKQHKYRPQQCWLKLLLHQLQ